MIKSQTLQMLLPVSFLNKVIMNELVVLPLEVLGANYLDPHPRSVLRVFCTLLSQITILHPMSTSIMKIP